MQPPRDLSRHPLFQVMFALQNIALADAARPGAGDRAAGRQPRPAVGQLRFDAGVVRAGRGVPGQLELQYRSVPAGDHRPPGRAVPGPGRGRRARAGSQRSATLPLGGRGRVAADGRPVERHGPRRTTGRGWCTSCSRAQAERQPEAPAVVRRAAALDLWRVERSGEPTGPSLAASRASDPKCAVGICLERSPELLLAVLGVLKAGGAYVPLDPAYTPDAAERSQYVLQDAEVSLVLTTAALSAGLDAGPAPTLVLDGEEAAAAAAPRAATTWTGRPRRRTWPTSCTRRARPAAPRA